MMNTINLDNPKTSFNRVYDKEVDFVTQEAHKRVFSLNKTQEAKPPSTRTSKQRVNRADQNNFRVLVDKNVEAAHESLPRLPVEKESSGLLGQGKYKVSKLDFTLQNKVTSSPVQMVPQSPVNSRKSDSELF